MFCGFALTKLNTILFSLIIVTDIIVSSSSSILWFRLNKATLEYAYLYSQIIIPLAFALTTWPIYFLFHFFKNVYPTIFNYRNKTNDGEPLCKCKMISNTNKRKIFRFFGKVRKCFGFAKTSTLTELQKIKKDYGEGDGEIILTGDGNDITNITGQSVDSVRDRTEFENENTSINEFDYDIWKCYIIFALYDTVINSLAILPILYFSSIFIIEAGQISLPLNMIGSYLYLGKQYTTAQIISVFLIIFSVTFGCYPELSEYWNLNSNSTIPPFMAETNSNDNPKELGGNYTNDDKSTTQIHVTHYVILFIMFIVVQILCTMSSIYREKMYKKYKLDPVKTVAIVATIQFPMGLITFPFLSIPLPKPAVYIAPSTYGTYIYNGTSILFNSDNGYSLFFVFIGYIFCVVFANIVDFIITQRISSTFNIVNNVSVLTLSILLMGWKELAGEAYQEVNMFEYASVFLIILAIINYWKGTPENEKLLTKPDGREILNSQVLLREGRGVLHPLNTINGIGADENTFFNNVGRFNNEFNQNKTMRTTEERTTQPIFNDSDSSSDDIAVFELVNGEIQWLKPKKKPINIELGRVEISKNEKRKNSSVPRLNLVDIANTTMSYNRGINSRINHPIITESIVQVEIVQSISNNNDDDDNK